MAHLLPLLAAAQIAGILLADAGWDDPRRAASLGVLCIAAGLCAPAWMRAGLALALALCAGALSLSLRLEAAHLDAVDHVFDATVEARICGVHRGGRRAEVDLCDGVIPAGQAAAPLPRRLRLSASRGEPDGDQVASLSPGDRVRMRLRVLPLQGHRNPGGRGTRWLARRGVGGRARLVKAALVVRVGGSVPAGAPELRERIGRFLMGRGPGGALLRALAVGDRGGLSSSHRSAFARLGIAHLLAVSGLHLTLVAGLAYALSLRALTARVRWTARFDLRPVALGLALAAATGYASLSGWGLPVRRAWVFSLAAGAAVALGRRRSGLHLFSMAAIAVLAVEPSALFEAGAQLSFAATGALLLAAPAPEREGSTGLRRALSAAVAGLRITSAAVAATAPILALHGGAGASASPVGLLANGVAVPWFGGVLLPGALVSAGLGALSGLDAGPWERLAGWLATPAAELAHGSLLAAEGAAATLPVSPPAGPPSLGAVTLAVALAVAAIRARRTAARVALVVGVTAVLRLAPVAPALPDPPRVVALDVGQGDAVLVEGRRGAILVDGAGAWPGGDHGRSAVLPALAHLGVARLDLAIATHADLDHRGGLPAVLEVLPVDRLWLPLHGARDPAFSDLLEVARRRGVTVSERSTSDTPVRVGDLSVRVLWPPGSLGPTSRNEASMVVRVEAEGRSVLLMGDVGGEAERALLRSGAALRSDVLKVAHHGSRTSSSEAFLRAVAPDIALVSAGCGDRRPLPDPEVLARLSRVGSAVWWTGRDGALLVSLGDVPAAWSWGAPGSRCQPPSDSSRTVSAALSR